MSETISLKESIERRLSQGIRHDPDLLHQLRTEPEAVLRPMIAEALGDDGELDLSAVSTVVHVEGPTELHFVVTPPMDDADEVVGFALGGISIAETLRAGSLDIDAGGVLAARDTTKGKKCGYGRTMSLEPECIKDPWG